MLSTKSSSVWCSDFEKILLTVVCKFSLELTFLSLLEMIGKICSHWGNGFKKYSTKLKYKPSCSWWTSECLGCVDAGLFRRKTDLHVGASKTSRELWSTEKEPRGIRSWRTPRMLQYFPIYILNLYGLRHTNLNVFWWIKLWELPHN